MQTQTHDLLSLAVLAMSTNNISWVIKGMSLTRIAYA
jgi:hypothetical protein